MRRFSAIGNSAKAGVRFVSYDHFKHALADAEVSIRTRVTWRMSDEARVRTGD